MPTSPTARGLAGLLLIALAGCPRSASNERFDLVIRGGRVMDPESGLDAPRDVGIRRGKIAAVSELPLTGLRMIDAAGRVVVPGFIDLRSHAHNSLVGGRVQAFDGVTTAIEAEAGQLPIPLAYQKAATTGRAINYGYTASSGLARMTVMVHTEPNGTWEGFESGLRQPGWADVKATGAQEQAINDLVEQALTDGALGIGLPLGYVPAATTDEVHRLSVLAAHHDAVVFPNRSGCRIGRSPATRCPGPISKETCFRRTPGPSRNMPGLIPARPTTTPARSRSTWSNGSSSR